MTRGAAAAVVLAALGCAAPPEGGTARDLAGDWRAVLESPGGELPFTLRISPEGAAVPAVARNGAEEAPFTSVERDGSRVKLRIDHYDSEIVAELSVDGDRLEGTWSRTDLEWVSRLPFRARRDDPARFRRERPEAARHADPGAVPRVAGHWAVTFRDEDGTVEARGEFRQIGEHVLGTFLTTTGDYRYLEGDYLDGFLRLSTFDGGHVFLFHARATSAGGLAGDFWSRDVYHATWEARRLSGPEEPALPDPFEQVGVTSSDGRVHFSFPDLEGNLLSPDDERFRGRVLLVQLFGSWCPNCNDEAPLLAEWHGRYRERGLEILGVAFEFTEDAERNRRFVRRFGERHGIGYPLLLGGTSGRAERDAVMPDLSGIEAVPTTLFIGRDGIVRYVHSGFAGPGTGAHHQALVAEFERRIEELLAEPSGGGG